MEREFFSCDCHAEGLILSEDDWGGDQGKHIEIAMWNYGSHGRVMPWSERFRWCWNILKSGLPWADEVILHPDEAKRLAESILKRVT